MGLINKTAATHQPSNRTRSRSTFLMNELSDQAMGLRTDKSEMKGDESPVKSGNASTDPKRYYGQSSSMTRNFLSDNSLIKRTVPTAATMGDMLGQSESDVESDDDFDHNCIGNLNQDVIRQQPATRHSLNSYANARSAGQTASVFTKKLTSEQEAMLKLLQAGATKTSPDQKAEGIQQGSILEEYLASPSSQKSTVSSKQFSLKTSSSVTSKPHDRSKSPPRMPQRLSLGAGDSTLDSTDQDGIEQVASTKGASPLFRVLPSPSKSTDSSSIEIPLKAPNHRDRSNLTPRLPRRFIEPVISMYEHGEKPSISEQFMSSSIRTEPNKSSVARSRKEPKRRDQSRTPPRPPRRSLTFTKSKSVDDLLTSGATDGDNRRGLHRERSTRWNLSGSQEDLAKLVLQGKQNERKKVENVVSRLGRVPVGQDQQTLMKTLLLGGKTPSDRIHTGVSSPPIETDAPLPSVSKTRWSAISPPTVTKRHSSDGSIGSNDQSPMFQGAVTEHIKRSLSNDRWMDRNERKMDRNERWLDGCSRGSNRRLDRPQRAPYESRMNRSNQEFPYFKDPPKSTTFSATGSVSLRTSRKCHVELSVYSSMGRLESLENPEELHIRERQGLPREVSKETSLIRTASWRHAARPARNSVYGPLPPEEDLLEDESPTPYSKNVVRRSRSLNNGLRKYIPSNIVAETPRNIEEPADGDSLDDDDSDLEPLNATISDVDDESSIGSEGKVFLVSVFPNLEQAKQDFLHRQNQT